MSQKCGRPSKFDPVLCEQAEKLCKLGATDVEMAEFFGVCEKTLNEWKQAYPEFLQSIKSGKTVADAEVASKLFHRATGYEHPDTHVSSYEGAVTLTPITKHYPPETAAGIFWLKNRQRGKWRDKQDVEHTGADGAPLIPTASVEETARRVAFLLAQGINAQEQG